jgi:PAS domain S-box-containing protein
MVCRFRVDGTVLFVNNASAQALGTSAEKLATINFWEFIAPGDRDHVRSMLDALSPRNLTIRIENRFTTTAGERWTLWTNRALAFDADGRVVEAQSSGIDITERKSVEEALAKNARRMGALYGLTDRLQRVGSVEQVYETAMDAIVKALGCDRASILLFDEAGVMRFVASRGLSQGYRTAVEGHSPWRADEKDPRPFGIADIDHSDLPEDLTRTVRAERIAALAFVPLLNEGRLIGKFMIYFPKPHEFTNDEFEVALTIGHQIALGVQRRRVESERRRAEEALRIRARQQQAVATLGEIALRERNLQSVLEHATIMVAQTLEVDYSKVLELLPGGDELLLRTGYGWKTAEVGKSRVGAGRDSQAGYTLLADVAVVVDDLRLETRFNGPRLLIDHGVVSGMSCIIRGPGAAPWGVLGAHAMRRIAFTQDDVSFLVSVANILSEAILRQHAEEALRENDRRKDEFLATLSHELRNPLAPLRNALYLLRRGAAESGAIHEMMERQLNHLVRLVDDLLEMTRISRGTFELRRERVDVATIVRNAVEASEPLIQRARHHLDICLPAEPLFLDGDPVRLAQILSNLLNNAAKYTEEGGRIDLEVRAEGGAAHIAVRDNGIGIEAQVLPRIFEMFGRADSAHARRGEASLGIGLALARRLAEMHGGRIDARSAGLGQGSEFTVRLPLAASVERHAVSAITPGVAPQLKRQRILVVDDNRDAADSLGMLLKVLGADVCIARDGVEALKTFSDYDPSVVLLDIGMPGMDGYEVARRIRDSFPERRTAIVAVTGWGQEEDRRRARDAGFDHHLIKPADVETLQGLLASL